MIKVGSERWEKKGSKMVVGAGRIDYSTIYICMEHHSKTNNTEFDLF